MKDLVHVFHFTDKQRELHSSSLARELQLAGDRPGVNTHVLISRACCPQQSGTANSRGDSLKEVPRQSRKSKD